jgi:hypothetical protein
MTQDALYLVAIVLLGGELNPIDVTSQLGIAATKSFVRGDPVMSNGVAKAQRKHGMWKLAVDYAGLGIAYGVTDLLDKVASRNCNFDVLANVDEAWFDIFSTDDSDVKGELKLKFSLSADALARLAELKLAIAFEHSVGRGSKSATSLQGS